jgi:acetyl esterase/lipase
MARDAGIPLRICMPSVPPVSRIMAYKYYTESPFPSFHEFYRGPILPWATMEYFGRTSIPWDVLEERLATLPELWFEPLAAKNWTGLCDTFLRTGECDPLRDEGESYGLKLVAGGNKVTLKRYIGAPHVFMYWSSFWQKKVYDQDSIRALKEAHGTA